MKKQDKEDDLITKYHWSDDPVLVGDIFRLIFIAVVMYYGLFN
jgi:hypothetical protein